LEVPPAGARASLDEILKTISEPRARLDGIVPLSGVHTANAVTPGEQIALNVSQAYAQTAEVTNRRSP
jgi:hypothetical protein